MPRHLLTDLAIRTAKLREKAYRLNDGDGLTLYVPPSGVKAWQLRYSLNGKGQTATLAKLVNMTLAEARGRADELRRIAAKGEHLTTHKRVERIKRAAAVATTFGAAAAAWVGREAKAQGWTDAYKSEVEASLRNHVSELNGVPLESLTASMFAPTLRGLEKRAPFMLTKVWSRVGAILDGAVMDGLIPLNPLPLARRRTRKGVERHFPAVTTLEGLGAILRAARASDPARGIQRAHALLAFTVQRIGEVVPARWDEFDLKALTWAIPRERMKRKDPQRGPHQVPIPPHLARELSDWRAVDGEGAIYVCAAPRDHREHITREAVEKFYRKTLMLAEKHSPHSWRSAFSTVCREAGKDGGAIESQLDHVVGNKVESAYDRSHRLELRRELMAWYESTLLAARDGAAVIALRKEVATNAA